MSALSTMDRECITERNFSRRHTEPGWIVFKHCALVRGIRPRPIQRNPGALHADYHNGDGVPRHGNASATR